MVDFKHVLVAVDFGESSQQALDLAIDIAKQSGAELSILHAYEIPVYAYDGASFIAVAELLAPIEGAAQKRLQSTLEAVRKTLPSARSILRSGVPATEILSAIDEIRPDLVVVGTHGRHGIGRAVLGSVAEKVVRFSPVPVLSVRRHSATPR